MLNQSQLNQGSRNNPQGFDTFWTEFRQPAAGNQSFVHENPSHSFGGAGTAPDNQKRYAKNNPAREKSQDASYMRLRKNLTNQQ